MRELDLKTWPRRQHYELFRGYADPFFNLCAEVDVTALRRASQVTGGPSFFAACLHGSLIAANAVEEFAYRMRGERVVVHDVIHAGSTVLRQDETFGFGYFDFTEEFAPFETAVRQEIDRVQRTTEVRPADERDDLIHYSVIPWVRFTSFSHASNNAGSSIPKIVFGGYTEAGGRTTMPVSVEVHHAMMDGLQVGRFFRRFQAELDRFRVTERA